MARVFRNARVWRLGITEFHHAVGLLADAAGVHRPQAVVGIDRGGRAPATAIAARLGLPVTMLGAVHNTSDAVALHATGRVTLDLRRIHVLAAERVLVVDDICGSGATLRATIRAVEALHPRTSIRTAVLCRNVGAAHTPDAWVWDVADWVAFPWETAPAGVTTEPLPVAAGVRSP